VDQYLHRDDSLRLSNRIQKFIYFFGKRY